MNAPVHFNAAAAHDDGPVPRINPRRPYIVTAEGLKRIILGATTGEGGDAGAHGGAHAGGKRLRLRAEPEQYWLAVVHSERGLLDGHARQTIAGAALLAGPRTAVVALVLGGIDESLAECGADLVVSLPEASAERWEPARDLALVQQAVARWQPAHVFLADGPDGGADLGRRLAARLGASVATRAVELARPEGKGGASAGGAGGAEPAFTVRSLCDGGRGYAVMPAPRVVIVAPEAVDEHLQELGRDEAVTLDGASSGAGMNGAAANGAAAGGASLAGKPAPLLSRPGAAGNAPALRTIALERVPATDVALEEADFIIAAGAGVSDVGLLQSLAADLGAAVGASRVAVDEGRFPRTRQVGATGKTVRASCYIAFGISGAVQHLQGIKDVRHVIAVNTDPGAPIAKRAGLTIIDDAQSLMKALRAAIAQENGGRHG
ncbi:electron transfer flavoprotein subunit alpha/FixB family protein [Derxia gummosa]|uniref:Electron transfer flavoprotein subunit alpha/FixB family protein n=1 Tax=Derxia gummosa DSM 723 TaxID=1121388 RepID=A0A9U5CTM0_9BURK|nr:electron transfer flavoprotein subunit alpha/FixB family protein [Derxia gummosa]